MNRRRVVVTGMGTVNPIGLNVQEFWNNALAGVSGADLITGFDTTEYKTKFACEVKGFDPSNWLPPSKMRRLDRYCQMALASALDAQADSGLDLDSRDRSDELEDRGAASDLDIIAMCTDRQNPFDAETLQALRNE